MQIVIEIPNEVYFHAIDVENRFLTPSEEIVLRDSIVNGTPLPEGHGRLIDAERYRNEMFNSRDFDFFKTLDMQPTIIKSDKGEEDEI